MCLKKKNPLRAQIFRYCRYESQNNESTVSEEFVFYVHLKCPLFRCEKWLVSWETRKLPALRTRGDPRTSSTHTTKRWIHHYHVKLKRLVLLGVSYLTKQNHCHIRCSMINICSSLTIEQRNSKIKFRDYQP